jgi:spore germination cell wall hydrolase CwlJ-like protein
MIIPYFDIDILYSTTNYCEKNKMKKLITLVILLAISNNSFSKTHKHHKHLKKITHHQQKSNNPVNITLANVKHNIVKHDKIHHISAQQLCVAKVIYHEARGSTVNDKLLTGITAVNRANQKEDFGKTPCQVISKRGQFPWKHHQLKDKKALHEALEQSEAILATLKTYNNKLPLYFHHKRLHDQWKGKILVAQAGAHKYFTE